MGQFLYISSVNLDIKSMEILLEPPAPDPTSFLVKSLLEIYRKKAPGAPPIPLLSFSNLYIKSFMESALGACWVNSFKFAR
jgi:hypothetical protein